MMTDPEIKSDLFDLLKTSELGKSLTGVLRKTARPFNSHKEDCIISVLANENGEIQEAYANVNIYVPDLYVSQDQCYVENGPRIKQLCKMAEELFRDRIWRGNRIRLSAQRVYEDSNHEHFINNRILLNIYNSNT